MQLTIPTETNSAKTSWRPDSFLLKWPNFLFFCLLVVTFTTLAWQIQRLQSQTINSTAVLNARTLVSTLISTKSQLRNLSKSKYKGDKIKVQAFGPYGVSIKTPRGLKTEFIRTAWTKIDASNTREFYRFDIVNGRTTLRFAHTFAAYGPRNSGKYEDARRIIEITTPIETVWEHNLRGVLSMLFLLVFCAALMLAFFNFILGNMRKEHALAKKFLAEAEQADILRTEFLSTTSHELRTPLTAIGGSLSIVLSDVLGAVPEKPKSLLVMANNNCKRLLTLVNDILDVNKIVAGEMSFNIEPHELNDLINSALENNRGYGETYNINFICDPVPEGNMVEVDFNRFQQVMSNLMSNAAKFSPEDGTVLIDVSSTNGTHKISIIDSGPGIPESFRSKVFGRFAQADSSDTKQTGGTGLGLRISKMIVEEFGGTIGFDSVEGEGATFYFILDAYQVREENPPQALAS